MEMHYINTGFPYTVTESFMDFFEGITGAPLNYAHTGTMHDQSVQEAVYWTMNMNPYKFGFSCPEITSYYGAYEVNDHFPRADVGRRAWEYPSMMNIEESTTIELQPQGDSLSSVHVTTEECIPNHQDINSSQVIWQDNVDPDTMTYEWFALMEFFLEEICISVLYGVLELLDLGEAVGTQSRGLSQELISLLPTMKFKFSNLFSRKKSGERCVICQMRYKIGNQQTKLPCNHVYHSECISKWLSINKVCPICNNEVFVEEAED
ncbi:hypothetical protein ACFE04_003280 [Oxalis oulophora]